PEPLPDRAEWAGGSKGADPADRVTLDETVGMAFLVVLDSMTPAERVAFVLHDVFQYPFAEVAAIVGRTPAACRQLAASARRRIRSSGAPETPRSRQAAVVKEFKDAWEAQDIDALVALLDPEVMAVGDSGGLAEAVVTAPVEGRMSVARKLVETVAQADGLTFLERTVNGGPGLVVLEGTVTGTVLAFDIADDRITRIWAMRNPEKLRAWVSD
ncbi:sigma factor-like helix-turn-helix DNA-binding protein, partial [Glycomyces tenuis]